MATLLEHSDRSCRANKCNCPHGAGAEGSSCPAKGALACRKGSCDDGYHREDKAAGYGAYLWCDELGVKARYAVETWCILR